MKKHIYATCFIASLLLLVSGVLHAEGNDKAFILADAALIDGEHVEDSELHEISGKGADGHTPNRPEAVSVILWDEKGSGKQSVQHNSMSGSGNTQNVSVRFNRN
ncbi:hypothetical protein [Sulfuriflexus mobilis]|uniref:hypothetical protein n=1 Tax=Sulfuriflexus mobilis TaxID=1811807 RepID=UPI000F83D6F4|nr:hypothetical protein [Sulfuriflexus mobilis]